MAGKSPSVTSQSSSSSSSSTSWLANISRRREARAGPFMADSSGAGRGGGIVVIGSDHGVTALAQLRERAIGIDQVFHRQHGEALPMVGDGLDGIGQPQHAEL